MTGGLINGGGGGGTSAELFEKGGRDGVTRVIQFSPKLLCMNGSCSESICRFGKQRKGGQD